MAISLYIGKFHTNGKPVLVNLNRFEFIEFIGDKPKIFTSNGNSLTIDEDYDSVIKELTEVIIISQKDPNDPKENGEGNGEGN